MQSTFNLPARREIAEQQLGTIVWKSPDRGYCLCPGGSFHTTRAGRRDCRVSLDGAPTIHCLHHSCHAAVAAANKTLRSAIGKAEVSRSPNNATGRDSSARSGSGSPHAAKARMRPVRPVREYKLDFSRVYTQQERRPRKPPG